MPPPPGTGGGEQPRTDDDNRGGALSRREQPVEERGLQPSRRLGGVLGEAKPPLAEEPSLLGDDYRTQLVGFRERRNSLLFLNENPCRLQRQGGGAV